METLVVVNQHRNHHHHQYYGRVKGCKPDRFGYSAPANHFRGINCRTFQSGAGLLPTPYKTITNSPVTPTIPTSEKTPSLTIKTWAVAASSPIPIDIPAKDVPFDDDAFGMIGENLPLSERWAGPAYSNSPPPSSLPIPKFSVRPKRTVSLELPVSDSVIKVDHPLSKSAPASPTREHSSSTRELFLGVDSATKTLRRILNLDVLDE